MKLDFLESWLDNFLNFEKLPKKNIFWLDTMQFLCQKFKYPENSFNSIHIAGSKGKGSVSAMISSILTEYGIQTGLYTSPHITDFLERITCNQSFFPEEIYTNAAKELIHPVNALVTDQLPGKREITWFELVTLYSFLVFRKAKVPWAVFETGLGGRLDATNVLSPQVSVLTPIELEHTNFLGDTLEKIAGEKAGIIKNNTPVWSSAQNNEVKQVFKSVASEKNSSIYFVDDYLCNYSFKYKKNGMKIFLDIDKFFIRPLETTLKLYGEFQVLNAALAALVVKTIFPNIPESIIEQGLSKTHLQARFEIIEKTDLLPKIIIDGAHTFRSLNFTLETLKDMKFKKMNLIFSCAADKNMEQMIPLFFKSRINFQNIFVTLPGFIKQGDFPQLKKIFSEAVKNYNSKTKCFYNENCSEAIKHAIESSKTNNLPLLCIGSFYLASELKNEISSMIPSQEN